MDIVTIDFETYYAPDYSLGKMTTEAYVRGDKFEVIGVGVKVNDNPADWYTGTREGVRTFLNSLDYSDKAILCHNTAFDGLILAEHFGIKPRLWLDTLSMAKPKYAVMVGGSLKNLVLKFGLGEKGTEVVDAFGKHRKDFTPTEINKYGDYCINDCELTYKLFKILSKGFPVSELMVIDNTIRMYTEAVFELDRFKLKAHLESEVARKQALLNKLGNGDPVAAKKILMSNPKFAGLLTAMGADVPMKVSPTTGKDTYAFAKTDQGMIDLTEHHNPAVAAVAAVRLGVKSTIEETRTQRLIDVAERGPLPVLLQYYGAHTGRFSGGDKLNLQNLPARKGNVIRSSICAPDGHKVIACDSSQIEARMLAYVANQADLVQAFREGRDVYSEFATKVYGYHVDKSNKDERFVGKTCILGLGYGMGHVKFRGTIKLQTGRDIGEAEAKRIVYLYRATYPMIKALWTRCDTLLNHMTTAQAGEFSVVTYDQHGIVLPNTMVLRYNALRVTPEPKRGSETRDKVFSAGFSYINDARAFKKFTARVVTGADPDDIPWTNIYGGKVTENIIQALARIVIADQMVEIGGHYPVKLQVHDENVCVVPDAQVVAAQQVMERVMSTPPSWAPDLPIACDDGAVAGQNYGECK